MNTHTLELFHDYYEKLVDAMTRTGGFDADTIRYCLAEICKLFGICKGVTVYYNSPLHEKQGKGEVLIPYDNGIEGKVALHKRIVNPNVTVIDCTVYIPVDAPDLEEDVLAKLDLAIRTVLIFISRNRLQDFVERTTFYDPNGYPNLNSFTRYMNSLSENNRLTGYTVARFNLRHFSLINREIGRMCGDIAIQNYFNCFNTVIADKGIVCRLGGDNFIMAFETSLMDDVTAILEGVPVIYDINDSKRVMINATAGIFTLPDDFKYNGVSDVMDTLLYCANIARNDDSRSIVSFDNDLLISKEKVMQVQHHFPKALKEHEFLVYYQPKIDIETGKLSGAEALCRWQKDGRIIPPSEFIPVLESSNDICKLDFYMLDIVCSDIRRWLDEGINVARISVNLSRKHMMDVDLLNHILRIIDKHNVPHKYIEIELTETTTDVGFTDLKRVVNGLQQAGIYTSVDDFGIGYSSLNLIREIPWNVLKIDKSFLPVEEDSESSSRSIMFKYVVAMARELGLECIAEGVEYANQVDVLIKNQCLFAQGYLFDKPLPLEEFEKRLHNHIYKIDRSKDH